MKTFGYLIAAIALAQANAQTVSPPMTTQTGAPNNVENPPTGSPATGPQSTTTSSNTRTTTTNPSTTNPSTTNPNMQPVQLGAQAPVQPPSTENGNANGGSPAPMSAAPADQPLTASTPTNLRDASGSNSLKEEKKTTGGSPSGVSLTEQKNDPKPTSGESTSDTSAEDTNTPTSTTPSDTAGGSSGSDDITADSADKTSSAQSVMASAAVVAISSAIMASLLV